VKALNEASHNGNEWRTEEATPRTWRRLAVDSIPSRVATWGEPCGTQWRNDTLIAYRIWLIKLCWLENLKITWMIWTLGCKIKLNMTWNVSAYIKLFRERKKENFLKLRMWKEVFNFTYCKSVKIENESPFQQILFWV